MHEPSQSESRANRATVASKPRNRGSPGRAAPSVRLADTDRREGIEQRRAQRQGRETGDLDEKSAREAVRMDLTALRGIESPPERYLAAVAMADNANEHRHYGTELRQQDASLAKEIKRAAFRRADALVAAVLRDLDETPAQGPTRRGELVLDGWAGVTRQPVQIVGETAKRYRIQSMSGETVRLAGRARAIERDQTALVPKRAVRVLQTSPEPPARTRADVPQEGPAHIRAWLDGVMESSSVESDNHLKRTNAMEESTQADDASGQRRATQAGARLHDISQVPEALREETRARWGVKVELNASRENGRYTGPVFASNEYVAQRVGNDSVVIHRREDIDFATSDNLKKRDESSRLNDVNLSIRYDGDTAKAYFHDPQRAAIEDMFRRIAKVAETTIEKPKARQTFVKQLDAVKDHMVERYRETKNRQFEARTSHSADRAPSEARESGAVER